MNESLPQSLPLLPRSSACTDNGRCSHCQWNPLHSVLNKEERTERGGGRGEGGGVGCSLTAVLGLKSRGEDREGRGERGGGRGERNQTLLTLDPS